MGVARDTQNYGGLTLMHWQAAPPLQSDVAKRPLMTLDLRRILDPGCAVLRHSIM